MLFYLKHGMIINNEVGRRWRQRRFCEQLQNLECYIKNTICYSRSLKVFLIIRNIFSHLAQLLGSLNRISTYLTYSLFRLFRQFSETAIQTQLPSVTYNGTLSEAFQSIACSGNQCLHSYLNAKKLSQQFSTLIFSSYIALTR